MHYNCTFCLLTYHLHRISSFFVCRCKKFPFMRKNCNFVTTLGLTNDEHRLIHNLRVKTPGFRKNYENVLFSFYGTNSSLIRIMSTIARNITYLAFLPSQWRRSLLGPVVGCREGRFYRPRLNTARPWTASEALCRARRSSCRNPRA